MEKDKILLKLLDIAEMLMLHKKPKHIKSSDIHIPHTAKKMLGILEQEEKINQRTLAKHMKISPQAVCENLKKLERVELITRESGVQKNENYIFLTEKGRELSGIYGTEIKRHSEHVFDNFDEDELQKLDTLLIKLTANLADKADT